MSASFKEIWMMKELGRLFYSDFWTAFLYFDPYPMPSNNKMTATLGKTRPDDWLE